jgi:hypothetical protein
MMKNKSNNFLLLLTVYVILLFCNSFSLLSQEQENGSPILFKKYFSIEQFHIQIVEPIKSIQNHTEFPLLVGHTQIVNIQPSENNSWLELDSIQKKIWRVEVKFDTKSKHILYFKQFEPGESGRLFVFDNERKHVIGAFTKHSKTRVGEFAFETMATSDLILQFETDLQSNDYQILLNEIGFIDTEILKTGFGASGSCEVNVNCIEGDPWKYIKQGIARILVKNGSSLFYCTGTLINNALRDQTPYFFTARHCGDGASESDYNQWIFDFNYEGDLCADPDTEPTPQTIVGASLKASGPTYTGSDFKLLLLNETVPADFLPFYNGWTLDSQITQSGVGIHHPQGDIKKISTFTESPISSDYDADVEDLNGNYWSVKWAETENGHGVTEGGSSGSPLFNSNGRIVGALTGGRSDCSALDDVDYFGKFSKSWIDNGSSSNVQLQPWLDPENSGISQIEGMGINDSLLIADFKADFVEININQSINFESLTFGRVDNYTWFFEGADNNTSTASDPQSISYSSYGSYDAILIVSNNITSDTIEKKDYIQVKPFLYPNPTSGAVTLAFGTEIPEDLEIQVTDLAGRRISFIQNISGTKINLYVDPLETGLYLLTVSTSSSKKNYKLLINK